jgi:hypothetical protein
MYKLCYFVPESHVELTKAALFGAGAGKLGNYDSCAWQCIGQGQFRPMDGSSPFLGQKGVVEVVSEYRVEMICEDSLIRAAVKALKNAHPYEEPAYEAFYLEQL